VLLRVDTLELVGLYQAVSRPGVGYSLSEVCVLLIIWINQHYERGDVPGVYPAE